MANNCVNKNLILYEASAGSGKTFALVNYYLKHILRNPKSFKNILAVTFTNKAVNELKTRILDELYLLSTQATESKHLDSFLNDNRSQQQIDNISLQAKTSLFNILHSYDQFSITTIDSFFKGVVSAFYNEINLFGDYTLELNTNNAIQYITEELLKERQDTGIINCLSLFTLRKLSTGKSWNITSNLNSFIQEIFSGLYMNKLSHNLNNDAELYKTIETKLEASKRMIANACKNFLFICKNYNLEKDDFPRAFLYNHINKLLLDISSENLIKILNSKTFQDAISPTNPKILKNNHPQTQQLSTQIYQTLHEITQASNNFLSYFALSENMYLYAVLQKCGKLLDQYREENKVLFVSDITFILNKLTNDYALEFIYEKVGTRYDHYLIDEFQDTSIYQWKNFKPLIQEAVSGIDGSALIVGDAKQSIYRWREASTNQNINDIYTNFKDSIQSKTLSTNYRSAKNIVDFNNSIFSDLAKETNSITNNDTIAKLFRNVQQIPASIKNGYVNLEFIEATSQNFNNNAIEKALQEIKTLQNIGYNASDITILVRNQKQAEYISTALTQIAATDKIYNYSFISDDGLLLSNFSVIRSLISTFRLIAEPNNLLYYTEVLLALNNDLSILQNYIKPDFENFPNELKNIIEYGFSLPLNQLCTEIIEILKLNTDIKNRIVLDSFQNNLLNFEINNSNNLYDFLLYWDNEGSTKKLQSNTNNDAINILTIHKSKGLEFNSVIIPFCNWPLDENISQTSPKILWTYSDEFMLHLPIGYKNYLNYSNYQNFFIEEKNKSIIDSLNMLYVAFTRSINHMKILCPKPKNKKINKINEVLFNIVNTNNYLSQHYNAAKQQVIVGKLDNLI